MNILIAGGSGFIGSVLIPRLLQRGNAISVVVAPKKQHTAMPRSVSVIEGDIVHPHFWPDLIEKHQVIINLAGSSIFRRWNRRVKEAIYTSRIRTTARIVDALQASSPANKHFFSSSGVGYYGYPMHETLAEESEPGSSFLARLAVAWETAALKARAFGVRVVLCRFGIVMGNHGGALMNMLPLFRYWCGGRWGSGRQWFSWIHAQDLAQAVLFLLDHQDIEGAVNFTAPHPVTNREMSQLLNKTLRIRPLIPAIPGCLIRALLGEFSDVFLKGQRVVPRKLLDGGFQFRYPFLEGCLTDLLGVKSKPSNVIPGGEKDVPYVRG
jgi:hypothetical protein